MWQAAQARRGRAAARRSLFGLAPARSPFQILAAPGAKLAMARAPRAAGEKQNGNRRAAQFGSSGSRGPYGHLPSSSAL